MRNYFASYKVKQMSKVAGIGMIDSGYGFTSLSASDDADISDVLKQLLESIAKQLGVEEKLIHITQFNKV